jgi:DNA gyrase subunit A
MDTSERNGELVRLCLVRAEDQLMCVTDSGVVIRTRCSEIREVGRNTQGVRVIRLGENERVVDVEPISKDAAEDDEPEGEVIEGVESDVGTTEGGEGGGEGDGES